MSNDEQSRQESPYYPQAPSAARAPEDDVTAADAISADGGHDNVGGDFTFELPDGECFHALANMAGQIVMISNNTKEIKVDAHLRLIASNSQECYAAFSNHELKEAGTAVAAIVFNAFAIAAVCEAHFPGSFASVMENVYAKLTLTDESEPGELPA